MKLDNFVGFMYESRFKGKVYLRPISAKKALKNFVSDNLKKSVLVSRFEKRNKTYAQIIVSKRYDSDKGVNSYFCTLDYRSRSQDAEKWLKTQLRIVFKRYKKVWFEIPARYKNILKYIAARGYQVKGIATICEVRGALENFSMKGDYVLPDGLKVSKMIKKDVDPVIRLTCSQFRKRPQHGPHSEEFLKCFKKMLLEEIKGSHAQYVIKNNREKIVGHFASFISLKDPFWGRKAGMHLCLDDALQGKGLLNYMYSILFNEMKKHKVKVFTGQTSHPAIIKRSIKMKRKPFVVNFEKDLKCYELSHFNNFLNIQC